MPRIKRNDGPQVIAFVNAKGGCGKSTLAVHAAAWMQSLSDPVALVDCDFQESSSEHLKRAIPEIPCFTAHSVDDIGKRIHEQRAAGRTVIADGPGGVQDQSLALMMLADQVVIPCGPSVYDIRATAQAVGLVKQVQARRGGGVPRGVIVLNRFQSVTNLGRGAQNALGQLGIPVAVQTVGLRTAIADSVTQDSTVFAMGSSARTAADELNALFRELFK